MGSSLCATPQNVSRAPPVIARIINVAENTKKEFIIWPIVLISYGAHLQRIARAGYREPLFDDKRQMIFPKADWKWQLSSRLVSSKKNATSFTNTKIFAFPYKVIPPPLRSASEIILMITSEGSESQA